MTSEDTARAPIRAPIVTPGPPISASIVSTSPVWTSARISRSRAEEGTDLPTLCEPEEDGLRRADSLQHHAEVLGQHLGGRQVIR